MNNLTASVCPRCSNMRFIKEMLICDICGFQDLSREDKIRRSKLNEKNPQWKGDKVGYTAIHDWVKYRLTKPALCECCGEVPPRDLANISGEYKRDLSDWEWLCRRCHMRKDGRLASFQDSDIQKKRNKKANLARYGHTQRRPRTKARTAKTTT